MFTESALSRPDRRRISSKACSGTLKRTHLELGGKAPVIVYDDADVEAVVAGLKAFGYYNAGQDCTAACRIYAGPKIHDKLVADLSSAVSSIRYNQQDDAQNEIGPLISKRQRDRVEMYIEEGRKVADDRPEPPRRTGNTSLAGARAIPKRPSQPNRPLKRAATALTGHPPA